MGGDGCVGNGGVVQKGRHQRGGSELDGTVESIVVVLSFDQTPGFNLEFFFDASRHLCVVGIQFLRHDGGRQPKTLGFGTGRMEDRQMPSIQRGDPGLGRLLEWGEMRKTTDASTIGTAIRMERVVLLSHRLGTPTLRPLQSFVRS